MFYDTLESQAEAMSCAQIEHDKSIKSDELYDLSMVLTDMGFVDVDSFIRRQCEANQIDFPPKQFSHFTHYESKSCQSQHSFSDQVGLANQPACETSIQKKHY